jgi:uncharacterized protein
MPHIAVFDTNVLLSAVGWKGRPYECIELARVGHVHAVTCREIMEELAEKLKSKLQFSDDDVSDTIADLLTFHSLVNITGKLQVVPADPDDDKILECATVGNATHVVSGDKRHLLPLSQFQGIAIVSPADFIRFNKASSP